jgi:hypothetical protein
MARFKIRQLAYSDTAAGSESQCVAVFLFDEKGNAVDVLPCQDVTAAGEKISTADLVYVNAVLDELRSLSGKPEAVAQFVETRLEEASLSFVLADPISIDEPDCNAARGRAATYLLPRNLPTIGRAS